MADGKRNEVASKMQLFNRTYCTGDINLKIFPENDNLHLKKLPRIIRIAKSGY